MKNRKFLALLSFSFLSFCFNLWCLSGNASKHNDRGVYDRHNDDYEKKDYNNCGNYACVL